MEGNNSIASPTKEELLHSLHQLVSSNRSDLDNGSVPLCLTPEVLLILNHGIEHLTDTRNGDRKVYGDLLYLQEALSRTKSLRLSHGGNSTIQAPVNIGIFRNLTQLDVKRVPPHWIVGLDKLQEKITLIRMSRCINFLEDILGKDSIQFSLSWNNLKKLYLSNNFIKELDGSLKLLPCLEVLDLSRNYLKHTDSYLQCLLELVHINLAYNSLNAVPSLSSSTCHKLKTLVLRANHLEHINGVERMTNLETLDLSGNILCDHGALLPLYSLSSLKQLYLDDNPLTYNTRHRALTAATLSSKVAMQLTLDGEKFTEMERKLSNNLRVSIRPPPDGLSESSSLCNGDSNSRRSSRQLVRRVKSNIVDEINEIPQPDDDESVASADVPEEINGVGTVDTVGHSSSPCGYGNTSVTKNRIETLREEFGDSWLQSFSSYQAGTPETTRKHTAPMADKASPAPSSESGSAADVSIMVDESVAESKPSEPNSQYGSIISDSDYLTPREGAEGGAESKYGSVEDDEQAISTATSSHGTDNESTFSTDIPGLNVTEDGEEFLEHDPFIVRHNDLYSEEFLITVTSEKIIEKNIEGVITEMLDLSALRDVQSVEVEGKHMVKCKLNYFRKDRRERCYVMEDLSDSMRLMDILQPEVAKTQSQRKSADTMECLKCGKQFLQKSVSKRRVGIACVHCGSDMVIEVSAAQHTHSTPYGSQGTSPSSSFLMTKPNAKNKKTDSLNTSSSSNSLYLSLLDEGDSATSPTHGNPDSIEAEARSQVPSKELELNEGSDVEVEEKAVETPPLSETPDSALSYRSVEGEESVLSDSQTHDEQVGPLPTYVVDPLSSYKFDPTNLSYIDHRLQLHLTVTYFQDGEQPKCVVRCKYVEYTKPDEHAGIVVITNLHLYILRLHPPLNRRVDVGSHIQLIQKTSLSEILYIEIGLAHQNIRLEFHKSGYCILLRDTNLGKLLHSCIARIFSDSSFGGSSKLKSILKINMEYYQHIGKCLPSISRSEDGQSISAAYTAAFKQLDSSDSCNIDLMEGCEAVSLISDDTTLYMLVEKYHYPFTRQRLPKKLSYFTLDMSVPIGDIAHLNVRKERCEVDIQGFEEESLEFSHKLVFVSPSSMMQFIDTLKGPWKDMYDVDLEVNFLS